MSSKYDKPTKQQLITLRTIRQLGPRVLAELNTASVRACLRRGWISRETIGRFTYDLTPMGNEVLDTWSDV